MNEGQAFGAVTILNATATGRGCSIAITDGVDARWTWTEQPGLVWRQRDVDDRLALAVLDLLQGAMDTPGPGADAGTRCEWPSARGLKTSSAAAAAMIRAATTHAPLRNDAIALLAVQANRHAGTTLTGAFDDQIATVRGGCHLTDNAARQVLLTIPTEAWDVAIWVPDASIAKARVKDIDTAPIRADIEEAEARLREGDVTGAMTQNGAAFTRLYAAAGLPVDDRPAQVALEAGALGAGLSGTGPAVAALFEKPTELPPVEGGRWAWSRVQEDTWTSS